ncbi:Crp/Fnr family transcriptional regulator [Halopseudomonas salegens]|uniref:cAMP-binding domain of CRP or a regulatory subunit of cAMP-dependent protein kinases n=1 Tax=Halopseudomonas salegens TaxID=1434072 RepID=A0A1H2F771_9GAMM|nr:Crp/Fnr family transcriptional regulator [Halopseudomonas salegens]SDU03169.1 cAMP-binding domain of CRP or a regulatory subunit of cAMP-dependent protein kinases [Halopseudomonas salegens]
MSLSQEQRQRVVHHPLLAHFSPDHQQALLADSQFREYPAHTVVIRQGEQAERFFMLLVGSVKLFRTSADGKEKVVEIIAAGHTFAEAVMFMKNSVYPVCAETLEPVHLVSFSNRLMLELLETHPKTCLHLLGHLSIRLHQRLDELENLSLQNATQRLTLYLVSQVRQQKDDSADIDLVLPKGLIASRLSIKPETLSRAMATLRARGLIAGRARHISIPSLSRLLAEFA